MLQKQVQQALKDKGLYTGNIDGDFGRLSLAALASALSVTADTKAIQQALKDKGLYTGNVDGILGSGSLTAALKSLGVTPETPPTVVSGDWDAKLEGVHPNLAKVVRRAAEICPIRFKVIEGVRSDKQACINWGKGRTATQCVAVGIASAYAQPKAAKVTWLRNPLATKHRRQADGYGRAVDLLGAPYGWTDLKPFDIVAKAVKQASKELGIPIKWGADWDNDGKPREKGETDSPHFELA